MIDAGHGHRSPSCAHDLADRRSSRARTRVHVRACTYAPSLLLLRFALPSTVASMLAVARLDGFATLAQSEGRGITPHG